MAGFRWQIDQKTVQIVLRRVDGHVCLDVDGLGPSPFVDPESVIETDPVAGALGVSTAAVHAMFLNPQDDADKTSWRNLAAALTNIRRHSSKHLELDTVALQWNSWIERAVPTAAMSVAQRRQVRSVSDWVQILYRLRLASL